MDLRHAANLWLSANGATAIPKRKGLKGLRRAVLAVSAFILPWIGVVQGHAQDGDMPGLVVSGPEAQSETGAPDRRTKPSGPAGGASAEPAKPPAKNQPKASAQEQKNSTRAKKEQTAHNKHSVAILVNDEPITHHEIDQRARFLGSNSPGLGKQVKEIFQSMVKRESTSRRLRSILEETVQDNRGKPREQVLAIFEKRKQAFAKQLQEQALAQARSRMQPEQRNRAQEELIEERLKMQEAKRLNILASVAEVDSTIEDVAKRNKMTSQQFFANLKRSGVEAQTIKDRIRAQISWSGVIRREYGRTISVNMADIDSQIANRESRNEIKLHLHKITLKLPNTLSQNVMAAKLREGEDLKARFSDCKSTEILARNVADAVFEDLGKISAGNISEPARSLLIEAKDGDMLPPLTQREGVVLYVVCGRDTNSAKAQVRSAIQQREFDIMAKRHIADLRRDAQIEYR